MNAQDPPGTEEVVRPRGAGLAHDPRFGPARFTPVRRGPGARQ